MLQDSTLTMLQSPMQKTHEWLCDFMDHTGRKDEQKTWQMLRATLHVLRDRLTIEQCAHLSAQLPMIIRGLFFEGWKPSYQPSDIRDRKAFVDAVSKEVGNIPDIDPNQAIDGTLHVLTTHVTDGELQKIKGMLPPELRSMWPECEC